MANSLADMATVEDVPSKAYRGIELMLLLPLLFYALLAVGVIIWGLQSSEAGALSALAAAGSGYLALLAFGLVSILVTPVLLYLDTSKIRDADVGWDPNPVLYAILGLFFSHLMMLHLVYKRHKYVVDWVDRDQWWILVAVGTVLPLAFSVLAMTVGAGSNTFLLVFLGLAYLVAVPFPVAIYRDATYVRLNSPDWQPNPGNYLNVAWFFFAFAPVLFAITGVYYLARRHRAIGTM